MNGLRQLEYTPEILFQRKSLRRIRQSILDRISYRSRITDIDELVPKLEGEEFRQMSKARGLMSTWVSEAEEKYTELL